MALPKEVQDCLEKMLAALTLKEKETFSSFLQGYLSAMPGNSILESMQEELGHSIQAELQEQEEDYAYMDEIWKIQYEPFLKGEE